MFGLECGHSPLANEIKEKQLTGFVGLVYVDCPKLPGEGSNEPARSALRQEIGVFREANPAVFAFEQAGPDYCLYIHLQEESTVFALRRLEEWSDLLRVRIERLLPELVPPERLPNVSFGQCLLEPITGDAGQHAHYEAFKQSIRETKRLRASREHSDKIREFHDILDNRLIRSVYQPIVSLAEGKVFGYEALTRGPEHSVFHSPVSLFDFAKDENSLYLMDKLAREKAIEGCRALRQEQKVFINIPADVIHDPRFTAGHTMQLLEQFGLLPSNVVFEITERSSIDDFTTAKRVLEHYRQQGYQIAIDDAGAGYSSLQAIAELHPDFIKVDRSLVHRIHADKIKECILETFLSFARKMNIRVIAEGIEEWADLDRLLAMNVDFAQGYLLGRPADRMKPPAWNMRRIIRRPADAAAL